MNKKSSELGLVAVSLVCILILAACNCSPTLRYITISPATSTIAVGTTQQYTATGYYSNGNVTQGFSVSGHRPAPPSLRLILFPASPPP